MISILFKLVHKFLDLWTYTRSFDLDTSSESYAYSYPRIKPACYNSPPPPSPKETFVFTSGFFRILSFPGEIEFNLYGLEATLAQVG